jgi:hypothetical protein
MAFVLSYNTEKSLVIQNWQLRLIKLVMQIMVGVYLGWSIFYQEGYQTSNTGIGLSQVKVSGAAYQVLNNTIKIWDGTDVGKFNSLKYFFIFSSISIQRT